MMYRFGLISLGLHSALLVGLVAWLQHAPPAGDELDKQGAVELVLVQTQGSGTPTAPSMPTPEVAAPAPPQAVQPQEPELPQPTAEAEEALPLPPPLPPTPPVERVAQPSPTHEAPTTPPIQRAQEAPQINLGGTDGETNAIVFGPRVIPASVDARFHNKEPVYPPESVRRAEQGAVILLVHVSPEGLPSRVDIARSSGFVTLDRAAQDAVIGWHFLPAVNNGQPVPFDMALRVVFHLD